LIEDGRGPMTFLADLDVRRHVLCLDEYLTASTERSCMSAILRLEREGLECPSDSEYYWEDELSEYAEEEKEASEGGFGPRGEGITGF